MVGARTPKIQSQLTIARANETPLPVTVNIPSKRSVVFEHALVFAGDLLPYGVIFLMTLMIGYGLGLEAAGFFSMAYVYVAIVTALVCGPNLLSLRRRMPGAESPGAVVAASLGLRVAVISIGALLVMSVLHTTDAQPGMISLITLLFFGRFLETAVDSPAISVQYLRGARYYFYLRLVVFALICGITGIGVLTASSAGLEWIATYYLIGSTVGILVALTSSRRLLLPIAGLKAEGCAQASDFGKFFLATALFVAASRLHPLIIGLFYGHAAAGLFAMVQNLFSVLAVAATVVASVFFWSRNRKVGAKILTGVPWPWLAGAIPGGLAMGAIGGAVMDFLFLQPLNSSAELRTVAWLLCLTTPLLMVQSILSSQLVLLKRDREMLMLSAVSAAIGLLLIALLVHNFGLIGAALAVGASALFSSMLGVIILQRTHE